MTESFDVMTRSSYSCRATQVHCSGLSVNYIGYGLDWTQNWQQFFLPSIQKQRHVHITVFVFHLQNGNAIARRVCW